MSDLELEKKKESLDTVCKKMFSFKPILAGLLKECVSEFKDLDTKEIEKCIENTPEKLTGVHPDEREPFIKGQDTASKLLYEGNVFYDALFYAYVPAEDTYIKLIVNIEAQTLISGTYPLLKRAVYYVSRLISSQYKTEFSNAGYGKIKKVYSIWICRNGPKKIHNTVTEYCITEKNVIGCFQDKKDNYDLIDIMVIGLGSLENTSDDNVIGYLSTVFSDSIKTEEKKKTLKERFDIMIDRETAKEMNGMCNWSDGVYLDGIQKGIIQGKAEGIMQGKAEGIMQGKAEGLLQGEARGIEKGRLEMLRQFMSNNHTFEEFTQLFNITDKNEIKFLRENL